MSLIHLYESLFYSLTFIVLMDHTQPVADEVVHSDARLMIAGPDAAQLKLSEN